MTAPLKAISLDIRPEKFSDMYEDAAYLTRIHSDEITQFKELMVLNPDFELYKALEAKKVLYVVTARDKGVLVGYFIFILAHHLHYKHVLAATEDIHFLHPSYRQGSTGLRLIKAAENYMKMLGANISLVRTKVAKSHAVIFERMGYTAMDITYGKRL